MSAFILMARRAVFGLLLFLFRLEISLRFLEGSRRLRVLGFECLRIGHQCRRSPGKLQARARVALSLFELELLLFELALREQALLGTVLA